MLCAKCNFGEVNFNENYCIACSNGAWENEVDRITDQRDEIETAIISVLTSHFEGFYPEFRRPSQLAIDIAATLAETFRWFSVEFTPRCRNNPRWDWVECPCKCYEAFSQLEQIRHEDSEFPLTAGKFVVPEFKGGMPSKEYLEFARGVALLEQRQESDCQPICAGQQIGYYGTVLDCGHKLAEHDDYGCLHDSCECKHPGERDNNE